MTQAIVSTWLQAAGEYAGVELALSEDGHCTMTLRDGGKCIVEAPENSGLVFLYSPISPLPDDPAQALWALKSAMALNMFGIQTAGATFGYDERTNCIMLTACARMDELDEPLFCGLLGEFIEAAIGAKSKYESTLVPDRPPAPIRV